MLHPYFLSTRDDYFSGFHCLPRFLCFWDRQLIGTPRLGLKRPVERRCYGFNYVLVSVATTLSHATEILVHGCGKFVLVYAFSR